LSCGLALGRCRGGGDGGDRVGWDGGHLGLGIATVFIVRAKCLIICKTPAVGLAARFSLAGDSWFTASENPEMGHPSTGEMCENLRTGGPKR